VDFIGSPGRSFMNHQLLQDLKAVRELISDPKNWIRGDLAVDLQNTPVDPEAPEACKFCLMGAILRVSPRPGVIVRASPLIDIIYRFLPESNYKQITKFNDDPMTTHQNVLAVLDQAIAKVEGAKYIPKDPS
jgi:hypothetical protein